MLRAAPPLQPHCTVAGILCLWLHKPFIEELLLLSCQANPLGWSALLIPRQENGTEDINQDYYTGPCSSKASASYCKINLQSHKTARLHKPYFAADGVNVVTFVLQAFHLLLITKTDKFKWL